MTTQLSNSEMNSQLPAYPIDKNNGLTKLEHISVHIMSGILSNECSRKNWQTPQDIANITVKHAKALLDELGKK